MGSGGMGECQVHAWGWPSPIEGAAGDNGMLWQVSPAAQFMGEGRRIEVDVDAEEKRECCAATPAAADTDRHCAKYPSTGLRVLVLPDPDLRFARWSRSPSF